MKGTCGCCQGFHVATPEPHENRPGLDALSYRVGTWSTFLDSMLARVSAAPELAMLKTREPSDPSIALLDAWACVADVLTFYQERIANEGYLRTALERRSILALGRLVGYEPRPGVAASAYLAFTLDAGYAATVPAGTQVQSMPKPGEDAQTFETSDSLDARAAWGIVRPRRTRPTPVVVVPHPSLPGIATLATNVKAQTTLYLAGTATRLKVNDVMIVEAEVPPPATPPPPPPSGTDPSPTFKTLWAPVRVVRVEPDPTLGRTAVVTRTFELIGEPSTKLPGTPPPPAAPPATAPPAADAAAAAADAAAAGAPAGAQAGSCVEPPKVEPATKPASSYTKLYKQLVSPKLAVSRKVASLASFAKAGKTAAPTDLTFSVAKAFLPSLKDSLFPALRKLRPVKALAVTVNAARAQAAFFGYNAPPQTTIADGQISTGEWQVEAEDNRLKHLSLDNAYDEIAPGSFVLAATSFRNIGVGAVAKVAGARVSPRTAYGISAKTTFVEIDGEPRFLLEIGDLTTGGLGSEGGSGVFTHGATITTNLMALRRNTAIYVQTEALPLAEQPIADPVAGDEIELDDLYQDLGGGRLAIVAGERTDVLDENGDVVEGIHGAELVRVAGLRQAPSGAGDTFHSTLILSEPLASKYKRDTVVIYGNVVHATHGQRQGEVLGSGDASKPWQSFEVKRPPITFVSAPTTSGVETTLTVRVDGVQWFVARSAADLGPRDRRVVVRIQDDGKTFVQTGNGVYGTRVNSGSENVTASYRSGIGKGGNVDVGQLSLLLTKPLGVVGVTNPIRASGGTDREGGGSARENIPLAVLALDRLVSLSDYADFARTFAGVGKAAALRVPSNTGELVRVVVAGVDDEPLDPTSDVVRNLHAALVRYGDPALAVEVTVRSVALLLLSARVRIAESYSYALVEPKLRDAAFDAFGFARRSIGQNASGSELVAALSAVPGVQYVDLDAFGAIHASADAPPTPEDIEDQVKEAIDGGPSTWVRVAADEIAFFDPNLPQTLVFSEIAP